MQPFFQKKRIHLDYASATPLHPLVRRAMLPYFDIEWANPGAVYKEGVIVSNTIKNFRRELAEVLNVRQQDITFTSGGTESNNLALFGVVESLHTDIPYEEIEVLSIKTEHPSVLEALEYLRKKGVVITYIPVMEDGRIDFNEFLKLLNKNVRLCTFAYVNSEIGVVQDLKKITRAVRKWNKENSTHVLVHTDASQAPLWLPCALDMLGVDLMTLDAGKCYGPKGSGVLVHRHWVELVPVTHGGGQENGLRSGTENVMSIAGCVRAIVRAQEGYASRSLAVAKLRDACITELTQTFPECVLNGSQEHRVANNINISLPGFDTEYATLYLDAKGIAVSTKSACGGAGGDGSYVVREISHDEGRALSTLRITLGEETSKNDLNKAVEVLEDFIKLMK